MPTKEIEDQPDPLRLPLLPYGEWYNYPHGLQQELALVILNGQEHSQRKQPPTVSISKAHWIELGQILADYLEGHRLKDIALDKDDRRQLDAISGTALKLIKLIEKALDTKNGSAPTRDARAAYFMCTWLDDRGDAVDPFLETLLALSELDPKKDFKHTSAWPSVDEISRRATFRGFFFSHLERAGLQEHIDRWWKDKTGLAVSYDDDEDTDYEDKPTYAQFLYKLYQPMRVRNRPGMTTSAVTKARRKARTGSPDWALIKKNLEVISRRLKQAD